jgi:hypothetical protein
LYANTKKQTNTPNIYTNKKGSKVRKELAQLLTAEETYGVKVLYCSEVGSKLFGTDHAESDSDYRFLYINSLENTILGNIKDSIKIGKQTKVKNTKDDIDFDGWSVQHWFKLLRKGETNALNLLFSMFSDNTILTADESFVHHIKCNYKKLLTKDMRSFKGYALAQAKRFGIKGEKYDELNKFKRYIETFPEDKNVKLGECFESFKTELKTNKYKHIKFVMAPGPRGTGFTGDIEYIAILGKMFEGGVTFNYFLENVKKIHGGFGNRTKTIAKTLDKTDWKAMSHAYLISSLCVELLSSKFMTFPVKDRSYILDIKQGKVPVDYVVDEIEKILENVEVMLLKTDLPDSVDEAFMNKTIISLYK